MTTLRRKAVDNVTRVLDLIIMLLTFTLALYLHAPKAIPADLLGFFSYKFSLSNFIALFLLLWGWSYLFSRLGLYDARRFTGILVEWFDIVKAVTVGVMLFGAVSVAFGRHNVNQNVFFTFWLSCCVGTVLERWLYRQYIIQLRTSGRNLRHVVFIGTNTRAFQLARKVLSRPEYGYRLRGFVDDGSHQAEKGPKVKIICTIQEFPHYLENHVVDEVYIVLPIKKYYEEIRSLITLCQDMGIVCRVPSNWFEIQTLKTVSFQMDEESILTVYTGSSHQLEYLWLKRLIDIVFSATALLLFAPFFLLLALLIQLTSPGPIFFKQERIGYNRRTFKMIKFRTMVVGAEDLQEQLEYLNEADRPAFKIKDDPRITPAGKWLRKTSLDEIPQLINVLLGDMSLVGPRPLPKRDAEGIEKRWQKRRFSMRPGLTCLWQIGKRNQMRFEDWMKLDLEYIDSWSIRLDFCIIAKTIPVIIRGTGH
ncbi:sugar transferase [candidate division KSB1 bacterium]|nr:sugar transferase [candidate division KSB1 bacterium]RQW08558.1 MAG: sugar transferase [candidate division KSB1 bacterium]